MLCLCALSSSYAAEVTTQTLTFSDAWVRSSVPGQVNGAGYIQIQNKGPQPERLLSASSNAAAMVELHTVITDNGVAKMREIKGLDIPAGQTVNMAPGGEHVMFLQIKEPFKEGSVIPVTLKFEKAGDVNVDFVAKPATHHQARSGEKSYVHDHARHHSAEHHSAEHHSAEHHSAEHHCAEHPAPTTPLDPTNGSSKP